MCSQENLFVSVVLALPLFKRVGKVKATWGKLTGVSSSTLTQIEPCQS